jgi:hypothetical protein
LAGVKDITQAIKLFSLSSTEAPKKLIWGAQDWEPLIDLSNKTTKMSRHLVTFIVLKLEHGYSFFKNFL